METVTPIDFDAARKFVDTPHGQIAYVERGSGPVALFIHGAPLNGYQWRHQLGELSDIRRVIALDTLGLGHTRLAPGQGLALRDQAAMFRAFLDALDVAAVDLVGNDSGGGAAQIFAARNPARVRSLTLINCEVDDYDDGNAAFVKFRDGLASGSLVKALQTAVRLPGVGRRAFAAAYQHPEAVSDETMTEVAPLCSSSSALSAWRAAATTVTCGDRRRTASVVSTAVSSRPTATMTTRARSTRACRSVSRLGSPANPSSAHGTKAFRITRG